MVAVSAAVCADDVPALHRLARHSNRPTAAASVADGAAGLVAAAPQRLRHKHRAQLPTAVIKTISPRSSFVYARLFYVGLLLLITVRRCSRGRRPLHKETRTCASSPSTRA